MIACMNLFELVGLVLLSNAFGLLVAMAVVK